MKLDAVVGVYEGMKNWHSGGQEKVTSIEFSKNVKKRTVQKHENTSIELYYFKDMIYFELKTYMKTIHCTDNIIVKRQISCAYGLLLPEILSKLNKYFSFLVP